MYAISIAIRIALEGLDGAGGGVEGVNLPRVVPLFIRSHKVGTFQISVSTWGTTGSVSWNVEGRKLSPRSLCASAAFLCGPLFERQLY
jgi:hypothetical protein